MTGTTWRLAVAAEGIDASGRTIHGDIGLGSLAEHGIDWSPIDIAQQELTADGLRGFDAVLLMGESPFGEEQLGDDPTIKHVARFGAGYDQVDLEACARRGIPVTNAPTGLRVPMAHAALTLLFALAHNLVPKSQLVHTGRWDQRAGLRGHGLASSTIGVVGLGGIGRETVRLLRGLGLEVMAYNRTPRPEFCAEQGVEQVELPELLRRSDFAILTVSSNAQTRHLIGARELEELGADGHLINVARGAVVDEPALVEALREGTIAGAALDVFETEPLPMTSPLLELDNVLLTPHSLCWTSDFTAATGAEVLGEVIAVAEGRAPAHLVNDPDGA
ncbi:dehydrogenase [Brachybacterium sp. MASK1Z-5]|uniref:Dehydrogenase n=1 Tax=Brachybacterium halotolerans TaxID=2795215 RepID=A0ABS1BE66_9MICO|nr:NAD(P)-dependent oxidoreductase [Brachybacterium halotolerans]MBK0332898.1 dehydrogenase [Brachybacterium halotolerans]